MTNIIALLTLMLLGMIATGVYLLKPPVPRQPQYDDYDE